MGYASEVAVKGALGLPDWRHLKREHVLQLLSMMADMDSRVALNILGQLPDITAFARVAMDDVAKAYDAALSSNSRSMEMVHQVHMERLALLGAELGKEVGADERLRLLNEVRDVHVSAVAKDTENKRFLSEQLEKRLAGVLAGALALGAVVYAAALRKTGSKQPVFES
jgi:hypothetical protein